MLNEALDLDYEIIGSEKFMAPMAAPIHSAIIMCLSARIFEYIVINKCGFVFTDNVDVHLPDGNLFRPDLIVVKKENAGIINWKKAIHGVPDMVVEVLSRSTRKKDLAIKKDIYESNGVKEYWIIDPLAKSIDVYILRDGKYYLDESYFKYTATNGKVSTKKKKLPISRKLKFRFLTTYLLKLTIFFRGAMILNLTR